MSIYSILQWHMEMESHSMVQETHLHTRFILCRVEMFTLMKMSHG